MGDELNETNQISAEQAEAAMVAGFADARGTEVPPGVKELNTEVAELPNENAPVAGYPAAEATYKAEAAQNAKAPQASEFQQLRAQVAQMSEAIKKSFEQVHGKFGEHNRLIQEVVKGRTAAPGSAGAPARKVGADAFRKLAQDYPDIAAHLTEGLETVLAAQATQSSAQSGMNQAAIDALVHARVAEIVRPMQAETGRKLAAIELTTLAPDWKQVTSSDGFARWFKAQPADAQARLYHSWDAGTVAKAVTDFKAASRNFATAKNQRDTRLEAATQPVGTGSGATTGISDDDALVLGFKAARAGG